MKFKYTYVLLFSLYISQALPANFFMAALPVMLRKHGASLDKIGLLNFLILPVILRSFWAPLVDSSRSYKTWIVPMQLLCLVGMFWMGQIDWVLQFGQLFLAAMLYTVASGTQDIGTDGMAVRSLEKHERPVGNAFSVAGVYIGTIVGAGVMLMLFDKISFEANIAILMVVIAIPIVLLWFYREPQAPAEARRVSLRNVWDACARKDMRMWNLLLFSIGAPSLMAGGMLRPMLVDRGFSMESMGVALGMIGPVASIAGCAFAPKIINRIGRHRALILGSVTQLLQILIYLGIDFFKVTQTGVYALLVFIAFLQGYAGIIIYTIVTDKSNPSSAGTDFTVQSSMVTLGALVAGVASGLIAQRLGYTGLYWIGLGLQVVLLVFVTLAVRPRHLEKEKSEPVAEAIPEPSAV